MVKVRFAPSPTGSLHVGSALTAVANRRFADDHGGSLLLRVDDTDAARDDPEALAGILRDLEWLGVAWDEGPVRQSERAEAHRAAASRLVAAGRARAEDAAIRFDEERRPTLVRGDGTPTYHLASVVDDADFGITHVIRGRDHLPNTPLHEALARALGFEPPQYLHHGLVVDESGRKLSKRDGGATVADLRAAGLPPEAVRAYLDELGLPRGDVQLDERRLRRLALEAIATLPDEELARRLGAPPSLAPALRGARDLREAAEWARTLLEPEPAAPEPGALPTLGRFRELLAATPEPVRPDAARSLVRELKAVGGDLRALRLVLTGASRGPELWAVVHGVPRDELLRRVDAAL